MKEKKVCNVEGCNLPHLARGWCRNHYQQWWREQNPGEKRERDRREYDRQYRQANQERNRKNARKWEQANPRKVREARKRCREKYKAQYQELLVGKSCVRCGLDDSRILVFHHLDPTTKNRKVSDCLRMDERVAEAAKCVVLCRNCHALIHWESKT